MNANKVEFLRTVADLLERGEAVEDSFELYDEHNGWYKASYSITTLFPLVVANGWTWRLRPRTIRIGEIDVPEPMREVPPVGTRYWCVQFSLKETTIALRWTNDAIDKALLRLGICHLTEEAARTHAKALVLISGGTWDE